MRQTALAVTLVAMAVVPRPAICQDIASPIIRPGQEVFFERVFKESHPRFGPGYSVETVRIEPSSVLVVLAGPAGAKTSVRLIHPSAACPSACTAAAGFLVSFDPDQPDALAVSEDIAQHLAGGAQVWSRVGDDRPEPATAFEAGGWVLKGALSAAWLLFFVLLALRATPPSGRWRQADVIAAATLAAGSAILHAAFANFGPGDWVVNFYSPAHGVAPSALLAMPEAVAGRTWWMVPAVTMALGAVAPVFVALLAGELGARPVAAWAAGVAFAANPLIVRFASDSERQMFTTFLFSAGLWAAARYVSTRSSAILLTFGLACLLCAHSRPEAGAFLAIGALLFGVTSGVPARTLWLPLLVLTATSAGIVMLGPMRMATQLSNPYNYTIGPENSVFVDPELTPLAWIALFALGVVVSIRRGDRFPLWALLTTVVVALAAPNLLLPLNTDDMASVRYQTLSIVPFSIAAGYGFSCLVGPVARRWGPRVGAIAVASLGAAALLSGLGTLFQVTAPRTPDLEFRFLLRSLPSLPQDAEVFAVSHGVCVNSMRGLDVVGSLAGRPDLKWREWPTEVSDRTGPAVFYRQPSCTAIAAKDLPSAERLLESATALGEAAFDRQPACLREWVLCQLAMRRYGAEPLVEETLAARRFAVEQYLTDEVPVGFYRVR